MKKRIKILSSTIVLASIGISIGTSSTLINSNLSTNKSLVAVNSTKKDANDISLVPAQANGQNANISTNAGPITFNNNVITALDWYGNELWHIDMSTKVSEPEKTISNNKVSGGYAGSWRRAWYNWDYDRTNNILWVLGYGLNSDQHIYGINAETGDFKYDNNLGRVGNGQNGTKSPYKFVTALSSGKVLIYGDPLKDYNAKAMIYDPKTNSHTEVSGNSASYLPTNKESINKSTYRWYFYNLIPLTSGINLAEVVAFDNGKNGTTGDNSSSRASYNVYGMLVDDSLNFIGQNQGSSSSFNNVIKIADGVPNFRNTTITPQRDYFTLLNSQTVSVTYNTVTLFNTSDPNNIQMKQVKMKNQNLIQTWTVDSNDNLYFKFLEDGIVYKVDGDTLKSGKTDFSPSTYLDLSSVSNESVKKDAKNFLIFNVYGYTGQLIMIDASYYNQINIYDEKNQISNDKGNTWGLAIAIKPNSYQNNTGDFKGVLNGSDSIQKVADFTIEDSVLKSKIPSEITKSDIKLLNDAFFKADDSKPFVISDIDDKAGTFKVTANLYKIPWFADTLPKDSVPKVVTYTFDGKGGTSKGKAQSIDNKVSWKDLNTSTDYDFLNMLPTNVKVDDIEALNPFQASFQSQKIVDSSGKQLYPKTTYSVDKQNNEDGTIEVTATYEYVPMSASYDGNIKTLYQFGKDKITEEQVLKYTSTKTYNIFKQNEASAFYFIGGKQSQDNTLQTVDVNNVPQLKSLLSAGTLPSSFLSLNSSSDSMNSAFLQFIDTTNSKGYPISKMSFKVEANDDKGTLTIKATMPSNYSPDGNPHNYEVQYTGLNQKQSYEFSFKDVNNVNDVNINAILPSSIDEGDIIKNFITYKGFDSNDFNVVLTPDDENGILGVQINLNNKYASTIGNSNGFQGYKINKTFTGFMTTTDYNNRFNITFKGDDDTKLLNLKNIQANELTTAFASGGSGLTIGGIKYNTLSDLVENLLVSTKGTSIPKGWSTANSGVTTQLYVDNSLGLASFYVSISKDKVSGASSDLNFVVTYSGFVKGNAVQTPDNLSFVSDKMLKNYLLTLSGFDKNKVDSLTPSEFAKWIEKNDNVKNLITYKTGQYIEKLNSNEYTLTVTPNDVQGTVSITINFGQMSNKDSLSEYSIQYTI